MSKKINRRDFIKTGTVTGLAATMSRNIRLFGKDDRKVRLGFLGLGNQGTSLLKMCLSMEDVEVLALSEINNEKLRNAQDLVEKSGRKRPEGYPGEEDYQKLVTRDDLDGVFVATPWLWHTPMTVATMRAGKYCAPEVWGASSIQECWDLIEAYEETGMPCMMLENHCYDRSNMAVLKMVREGLFGELIHGECGYCHDLRGIKFNPGVQFGPGARGEAEWRTYHSINRNGDLYPTHGLGPIANCFDIDRSNRMVTLTSTATKSRSLQEYIINQVGRDHPNAKIKFKLGDIVTTVIKCQNGETIMINHDTNLPRPYSNIYVIQGTKGIWMEHRALVNAIYLDGKSPEEHKWEPFDKYYPEYEHPLWQNFLNEGVRGGHGGAGYLKSRAFVECVKRKIPTPIDVYDTAAWIAVSPLSEESIAKGSAPVEFPDFTRGMWMKNKPIFGLTGEY